MFERILNFNNLKKESSFLWGPRQVGKTTLLKKLFPQSLFYNLLISREFERLVRDPTILADEILAQKDRIQGPIVIDEVQKLPSLLDEVHRLITDYEFQFILCGSSARKLKRGGGNLLGGRALRYELFPLVYPEIKNFDLLRALNHGTVPRHYLSQRPKLLIQSYIGDYLKEEILAEALSRNAQTFHHFLESASFSNGEFINYQNIASECGISPTTVKTYYQILEDTLIGRLILSFQKRPKRRVIQAPKFYFFDIGVVNYLLKRSEIQPGSEIFGKALEHFIFLEITAYSHYSQKYLPITFWRTTSQLEVDFILGDHEVAVEVKSTTHVQEKHLNGIKKFNEEYASKKRIVISLDPKPRKINAIDVYPVEFFLKALWAGDIL